MSVAHRRKEKNPRPRKLVWRHSGLRGRGMAAELCGVLRVGMCRVPEVGVGSMTEVRAWGLSLGQV